MTREEFLLMLRKQETVPFIRNMSVDNLPTFDEGIVLPVTPEVYDWHRAKSPRWANRTSFVFGEGMDAFVYFWKEGGDYFAVRLSHEQTEDFCALTTDEEPRVRQRPGIQWRVECKTSGKGHSVAGNFDDAIAEAQAQCTTDTSKWVVWAEPANVRMAEVTIRGALWVKSRLTGEEVTQFMRRHKKSIAGLSFLMGISQKRIRQVRAKGLRDQRAIRDWLEAITDEDPGPLPQKSRISRRNQETDCGYCGCPLFVGESAYEYGMSVYCSVRCCRDSRSFGKEPAA